MPSSTSGGPGEKGAGGGPAGAGRDAPKPALFTVGCQGRRASDLAGELARRGVACVIDVRYNPWSRRPEFTGKALAVALASRGIAYLHLRGLGAPPELRRAFQDNPDMAQFLTAFKAHLFQQGPALDQLQEALDRYGRVCLLCQEHDPSQCHRLAVAEEACRRAPGLPLEHIV
ncbi:MAG: DUF488 domain-containing protein [Acetobacteraceae bacterium]|nr:DUF488 domain-containing protein [Acetobacteraceae bacterium]